MNTGDLLKELHSNLGHRISQGRNVIEDLDSMEDGEGPWKRYTSELDEIFGRLEKSLLHVAVLGQFKRGKSTLINALLGNEVLPSSLLPLTSIPTLVKYGEKPCAVIEFKDGSSQDIEIERLSEFVTEKGNPANERGVERAELYCNAPLLAGGIVIIDTPGIGSTFTHNTDVTTGFLPHCDVGLFLTSPDPPLTEVEAEFLDLVSRRVTHLIFILNKIDCLPQEGVDEVGSFLEKTLSENTGCGSDCRIFPVSALRGLEGRKAGDETKWEKSGMRMLEDYLKGFFLKEKEEQFIQESFALAEERLTLLLKKSDDLIIRVNKEALAIFEVKALPPLREPFSLKWPNFYWEHIIFSCGLFEVAKKIVYHALPCRALRKILTREALEEAGNLILRNAGKLRYSVIDGLERVIKRINGRLISELEHALCDTRKAARDALSLRQEKNDSVTFLIGALKEKKSLLECLSRKEGII
jgi:GTP-binding protein EngB required for normal cell division